MNPFVDLFKSAATVKLTENGGITYSSSLDPMVDAFFHLPAKRNAPEHEIIGLFMAALQSNKTLALRLLFWLRDCRGGAGEKRVPKIIYDHLSRIDPDLMVSILPNLPHYGRWDDILALPTPQVQNTADRAIWAAVTNGDRLAAKWSPREKRNPNLAERICRTNKINPALYRRTLAKTTDVVETPMCHRQWGSITYPAVPSQAMRQYSRAFRRHDEARFQRFLDSVNRGESKINTETLMPYEVIRQNSQDSKTAQTLWNNLPDYVPEGINFLPMIDLSGSMYTNVSPGLSAMRVAIALGLYLAERNSSEFANSFLSFTNNPTLHYLEPKHSLSQKIEAINQSPKGFSTNLQKAFDVIVDVAIASRCSQEELPDYLIVLSDMEFNAQGKQRTDYHLAKEKFAAHGYSCPNLIWWNIASRSTTTPVRFNDQGTCLIGGASPSVIKNLLAGNLTPYTMMMQTLGDSRYDYIQGKL